MNDLSAIKLIIQNSRFYAHLYKIEKVEDIKKIIKIHKKLYKKAKHHCYALKYYLPSESKKIDFFKDDGEVGHPGKILLEILHKYNLKNHALVVSRIFGGKKLGVGGVRRAFKNAGEYVIEIYSESQISK
jgi:putative IMPACT (imprinted ancient) family translation regulator